MTKDSSLRILRISFLSTILASIVCIFLTVGVSAHSLSPGQELGSASAASSVTVKIVKTSSGYNFSPRMITVTQGEKATLCNTTSISQTITYQGYSIYTIAAHTCASATVNFSPGKYTVHLKSNPKASLTIIVK